jgi:CBS domain-containing protein
MKVSDVMTRDVRTVASEATIQEAAAAMADIDVGSIPVVAGDQLAGIVTDRDIAIRAVAMGLGPDTSVADVMSQGVHFCYEHDDLAKVAKEMGGQKVRRLPVLDQSKRLVGIVALGDIAVSPDPAKAGAALSEISEPSVV